MHNEALQASMAYQPATQEHVAFCFDVLTHNYRQNSPSPTIPFAQAHCPLFVTWSKLTRYGDLRLRGCIGTLQPRQLHTALRDYALTSALRDKRFPPIKENELSQLSCTVSLLHTFEQATGWQDWDIGTHGLVIQFRDPRTHEQRSATYLPEIAQAEGWTKQYTIDSLVSKAGYHGQVTQRLRDSLSLTRYQSSMYIMTHKEYLDHTGGPTDPLPSVDNPVAVTALA